MKNRESVILRDLEGDYLAGQKYIVSLFEKNKVSDAMISETRIVFEALCYKVFEQRENPQSEVIVSSYRRMGDTAIELTFFGGRFDPDPQDPSIFSPEDSILKAYADKIDYSYRSGLNRITITITRNHLATVGIYALSMLLAIVVYALLRYAASEETVQMVGDKFIIPMEQVFVNAILMVGTPVTFLSLLKHLTDTYIISESNSNARRLHRNTISSSLLSVILAVIVSRVLTAVFFINGPMSGKYPHGKINLDPAELIPSLMPSDIFAPFQTVMPYSLIILAALTTYAFCSVGKYFDQIKETIDSAYVLFARMLSVLMYLLPVCAFCMIMDILILDGPLIILILAELILLTFASLIVLIAYYIIRLRIRDIRPIPFLKKMMPLLRENASIASAFDAVPYNIRYCAKTYGFDRKRIEQTMPVLAQINLDGNCYMITVIAMLCLAMASTPLSIGDTVVVGILVLLLSLGAPNQPGSCLVGLTIVMIFLQANDLAAIALIAEVFFGGILNLTNIVGDIVTIAIQEAGECGGADELNRMLDQ